MTVNTQALLYNPIYKHFGVDAVLQPGDGDAETVTVRVIDETNGIMLSAGGRVQVGTMHAACSVRAAELTANELTPAQCDGGTITFNGQSWNIKAVRPIPALEGESAGEYWFVLLEAA